MAKVILMVGLPGAGKTIKAKQLEIQEKAVRLTPDEWHIQLFGQDLDAPEHDTRHNTIESLLWKLAEKLAGVGVNTILDFGFWSKEERDNAKKKIKAMRAEYEVYYQKVSKEDMIRRLKLRNSLDASSSFVIPEEKVLLWYFLFEDLDEEELADHCNMDSI